MVLIDHMFADSFDPSLGSPYELSVRLISSDCSSESMSTECAEIAQENILSELFEQPRDIHAVGRIGDIECMVPRHVFEVDLQA
jgi:hypothetical protein